MRIVGLTGGISVGKSTVSSTLRAEGVELVDADVIAHKATHKGSWGYWRVVRALGHQILTKEGDLDRQLIGRLVFA